MDFLVRSACIVISLTTSLSCVAPGSYEDRQRSYDTVVELRAAGDERCSDPAPYTHFRACLVHDAAYELARRVRCEGRPDPFGYTTEQARFIADLNLAYVMAQDGYAEWLVAMYFLAVRWGGWVGWHFGGCNA